MKVCLVGNYERKHAKLTISREEGRAWAERWGGCNETRKTE
jgi:hypothetical protein